MLKNVGLWVMLFLTEICFGQPPMIGPSLKGMIGSFKPAIDSTAIANWPILTQPKISGNGKYVGYVVSIEERNINRLFVVKEDSSLILEISLSGEYLFTEDSRYVICVNLHDSLCIGDLRKGTWSYISDVSGFSLMGNSILYQRKTEDGVLFIYHRKAGKCLKFFSVVRWLKSENGKVILMARRRANEDIEVVMLDIVSGKRIFVHKVHKLEDVVMDAKGEQVAMTLNPQGDVFLYFRRGMAAAKLIKVPPDFKLSIGYFGTFSKNGSYLCLNVVDKGIPVKRTQESTVKIWSYMDSKLLSQRMENMEKKEYRMIFRSTDYRFIMVSGENDWFFFPQRMDSVVLIRSQDEPVSGTELNWNKKGQYRWELLSIKSGVKNLFLTGCDIPIVELSPSGKYIIYFDNKVHQYFVYESGTKIRKCITSGIEEIWDKSAYSGSYGRSIGGWEVNDEAVIIYGQHDIWRIDPKGREKPVNLTNKYGDRNEIVFFLGLNEYNFRAIRKHESLILSAFNKRSKENGFYKKVCNDIGDPESLFMGPYIFDITDNPSLPPSVNFSPMKANGGKLHLVRRMSATESPNFFLTKDFISFRQLTKVYPERMYNWYSSELHHWKTSANRVLQGVLYKPENFDSTKVYPIIFHYYENRSDALNAFLMPKVLDGGCSINIPYYTSNGYLIFCPDIYYEIGDPLKGTYDAIVSAAEYVSRLPYVDGERMGLQGCSWGAVQTNYLIAHTKLFAAACSASGLGNWISSYGGLMSSGESMQGMYENGQLRMGGTLWDKPDVYIKNSAVFGVNNISTPLLLMHTTDDDICPISNIIEFFTSLRRMGKKSWMLVYHGNHCLYGDSANDFGIRMEQFFNHYLKNKPAPIWMTRCLESEDEFFKENLNPDDSILTPGKGLMSDQ